MHTPTVRNLIQTESMAPLPATFRHANIWISYPHQRCMCQSLRSLGRLACSPLCRSQRSPDPSFRWLLLHQPATARWDLPTPHGTRRHGSGSAPAEGLNGRMRTMNSMTGQGTTCVPTPPHPAAQDHQHLRHCHLLNAEVLARSLPASQPFKALLLVTLGITSRRGPHIVCQYKWKPLNGTRRAQTDTLETLLRPCRRFQAHVGGYHGRHCPKGCLLRVCNPIKYYPRHSVL